MEPPDRVSTADVLDAEQVDAKSTQYDSAHHETEVSTEKRTDEGRGLAIIADCFIDECGSAGRADVLSHVPIYLRESMQPLNVSTRERETSRRRCQDIRVNLEI